ncbi:MAG: TIGR00153 family protein [Acidobacteriota bacterium]|nr:MAG: TIGR00153 family protein [Acidobacteriota bacterium]
MRVILDLFGRSPFHALQGHMEKVLEPVSELHGFFEAFLGGDTERAREVRKRILKLEHEADLVKNEIRDHLPKSYFLPVDRRDLLALLHQQDKLADLCEDIVIVATLKADLRLPADLHGAVLKEIDLALEACSTAREIIGRLDELLETSFGGAQADEVVKLIDRVGAQEHEVDKHAYTTARELFAREGEIGAVDLSLWQKLLELIGGLANAAESIGDQVRLMLSR